MAITIIKAMPSAVKIPFQRFPSFNHQSRVQLMAAPTANSMTFGSRKGKGERKMKDAPPKCHTKVKFFMIEQPRSMKTPFP